MGFYQKQPVDPKKCRAVYLWTGLRTPGIYMVMAAGEAQQFTTGFDLRRDPNFVGGLKIDCMGWTGPLTGKKQPYRVKGSFPGQFHKQIVISGSNGDFAIPVQEVPHKEVEAYMKSSSTEFA